MTKTRKQYEDQKTRLLSNKETQIKHIWRSTEREIKRLKKRAEKQQETIDKLVQQEVENARNKYIGELAPQISAQISQDYQTLQTRSDLAAISREENQKARRIAATLDKIADESIGEELLSLTEVSPVIRQAIEVYRNHGELPHQTIHSYIASNPDENSISLLVPIDGKENKRLAKNLEEKIDLILDQKKLTLNAQGTLKRGEVDNYQAAEIKFSAELEDINGFLHYTIKPKNHTNLEKLAENLTEKLTTLQPNSFKTANLAHEIVPIMWEVISQLNKSGTAYHEKPEWLSLEETASELEMTAKGVSILAGKGRLERQGDTISRDSIEKYRENKTFGKLAPKLKTPSRPGIRDHICIAYATEASTPLQIKSYALRKLEEFGAEINAHQLAEILGSKNNNVASVLANNQGWEPIRIGKSREKLYAAEDVRQYIEERTPSPTRGWLKK